MIPIMYRQNNDTTYVPPQNTDRGCGMSYASLYRAKKLELRLKKERGLIG